MKSLFAVAVFLFLGSIQVQAGAEGHGGEVVICPDSKPILYDVYEAKTLRDLNLNLGATNLSALDKVKLALDRYALRDAVHAKKYQGWANTFFAEAKIDNFDVAPIEDAKHIVLPPHCTISQLIDQKAPDLEGDKRYF